MSSTLAYYILAAFLGALLSWLITGANKKQSKLIAENARKERAAMNDLLTEYNLFKSDAKSQLHLKDKELQKLKKSSAFPDIIADAQEKEITHWKNKAKELESRINKGSSENNISKKSSDVKQLKQQLAKAQKELSSKEQHIKRLQSTQEKSTGRKKLDKERDEKKIAKLKEQLKAVKIKLKAKPKKEIEIIELKETLDLAKLRKLLKQGKLTKKSKKVSKKKKKKKKSKKSKTTPISAPIETPNFSKGKSILDVIPELKTDS